MWSMGKNKCDSLHNATLKLNNPIAGQHRLRQLTQPTQNKSGLQIRTCKIELSSLLSIGHASAQRGGNTDIQRHLMCFTQQLPGAYKIKFIISR